MTVGFRWRLQQKWQKSWTIWSLIDLQQSYEVSRTKEKKYYAAVGTLLFMNCLNVSFRVKHIFQEKNKFVIMTSVFSRYSYDLEKCGPVLLDACPT